MLQGRLNFLTILTKSTSSFEYEDIINDFSRMKSKKTYVNNNNEQLTHKILI